MSTHSEVLRGRTAHERRFLNRHSREQLRALGSCVMLGHSWQELGITIENMAKPGKFGRNVVYAELDDYDEIAIKAAPLSSKRRVDHIWEAGADLFLIDLDDHTAESSLQLHIDSVSGIVERRPLTKARIASAVAFLRENQEQTIVPDEARLEKFAARERALCERMQLVDIELIS